MAASRGRAPAGRSAGPPPPSAAGRERGDGDAADLRLATLVHDLAVEVDAVLAVLLVLLLHGDPGRERLAGPGLLREAHLVLAQVAHADEVGATELVGELGPRVALFDVLEEQLLLGHRY